MQKCHVSITTSISQQVRVCVGRARAASVIPEVWSQEVSALPEKMSMQVPGQPQHESGASTHVQHRPSLQYRLLQERVHWKHLNTKGVFSRCSRLCMRPLHTGRETGAAYTEHSTAKLWSDKTAHYCERAFFMPRTLSPSHRNLLWHKCFPHAKQCPDCLQNLCAPTMSTGATA